jgi:CBS domain-containing protein
MPHLVMVVLDDLKPLHGLLLAWRAVGVTGATILESVGGYRAETWLDRAGLGALSRLFEDDDLRRRTVLTVVPDELLDEVVAEADRVVGGFQRPGSGLLFAIPTARVLGLEKARPAQPPKAAAAHGDWSEARDTTVEELVAAQQLLPATVAPDTVLSDVVAVMLNQPEVEVVSVVREGVLVGLIDIHLLANHFFFHILPEEFLSEVTDLEHVMEFANRSRATFAGDLMKEPAWVKRNETLKEAFKRMHDRHLTGLPVVDDHRHVVGYITMLQLLSVGAHRKPLATQKRAGE